VIPFQTVALPGGQYATAGSFKAATITTNAISMAVATNSLGFSAVAKLDSGLPIAGRQPQTGTPEGLSDGYVALDKLGAGSFRLNGVDFSALDDGLHVLRVRVFADTPNRPGVFNEFTAFFYLKRGLATGWTLDGSLADFPAPITSQTRNASSNLNRLDGLYVTNDDRYLYVGLAGRVDTSEGLTNGFSLWMDTDPGAGTGLRDLSKLNDDSGPAPRLLSNTKITLPSTFGAEYGLAVFRHSNLGSSPEAPTVGQPVYPPVIGAQAGLYKVQDAITTILNPRKCALAYVPRANKTDPASGAEIAIPLRELYSSALAQGARIGFIGLLNTTGENGGTLLSSDVTRGTLGGRPAPASWLSNQILPSQANISNDWGVNPITLIQSVNYNIVYAGAPTSGFLLKSRPYPVGHSAGVSAVEVTVVNTGGQSLAGPLNVLVQVPNGVQVTNPTDTSLLQPGVPYLRLSTSSLAPGGTASVVVYFHSSSAFTPTFALRSGPGVL
jgi:hypothetical protein